MKNYIVAYVLSSFAIISSAQTPTTVHTPNGTVVAALVIPELSSQQIQQINDEATLFYPNATILADASSTYNCHGFAWHLSEGNTNTVWINTPVDDAYWNDDNFIEVCNINNASTVSYANDDHSAIKSIITGKYDSKWGNYPLLRHAPEYVPYVSTNRKYYTRTPPINGSSIVCSTISTYTIENLVGSTVSWSKSSNLTYVSGQNTTSYTVKANSSTTSGWGWVEAAINTGCGTATLPRKEFWVGAPNAQPIAIPSYSGSNCYYTASATSPSYVDNYLWTSSSNIQVFPDYISCKFFPFGLGQVRGTSVYFKFSSGTSGLIYARGTNSCGTGASSYKSVIKTAGGGWFFSIGPNPVYSTLSINTEKQSVGSRDVVSGLAIEIDGLKTYQIVLLNQQQEEVLESEYELEAEARLEVGTFKPGTYILHIIIGEEVLVHQIIKE